MDEQNKRFLFHADFTVLSKLKLIKWACICFNYFKSAGNFFSKKKQKKTQFLMYLLGFSISFSYLYSVNNSKYMPKNRLFKLLNYFSKNYFFYSFKHLIFRNASQFHLEIILSNLFSSASINMLKTPEQPLQFQS